MKFSAKASNICEANNKNKSIHFLSPYMIVNRVSNMNSKNKLKKIFKISKIIRKRWKFSKQAPNICETNNKNKYRSLITQTSFSVSYPPTTRKLLILRILLDPYLVESPTVTRRLPDTSNLIGSTITLSKCPTNICKTTNLLPTHTRQSYKKNNQVQKFSESVKKQSKKAQKISESVKKQSKN